MLYFAFCGADYITLCLNVRKAADSFDILNYNWELIQGSKMLFGRHHFTGRKNHYLFFLVSCICTVCLGNIIPYSFWILMFNLTQRSLSSTMGGGLLLVKPHRRKLKCTCFFSFIKGVQKSKLTFYIKWIMNCVPHT